MAARLPVIRRAPAHWLDWWGFAGGSEPAVRAVLPASRRDIVEPTEALRARSLAAVRRPWWALGRAAVAAMLESELAAAAAPMVWANMVLHACTDAPQMLARWQAALAPEGFLMFSTLGPDTLRELRALYAEAGWGAPHPPFTDMHDIGDQLVQGGFADPVMDQERLTLHWSTPEALLAELRTLGGNIGRDRVPGLRTPRWRARLLAALRERADAQGRIGLSFEVVYGHAFKALPRARAGAPTVVPLEQVRASLAAHRAKPGKL